jgi:hypothetical protein
MRMNNTMLINSNMGLFHMHCGLLKMKGCNGVGWKQKYSPGVAAKQMKL